MPSYTAVGANVAHLLREEMANVARHVIESDDTPEMRGIALDSANVFSNLGRPFSTLSGRTGDFGAIHPLVFGRSGAIEYGNMRNVIGQDAPPMLSLAEAYPLASSAAQRQTEWLEINLRVIQGTLAIHRNQWLALSSGNPVNNFLADWMKDPVATLHQQIYTDFFGNGAGQVGTVTSATGTMTNAGDSSVLVLSTTARSLWRGQLLTMYDATGTAPVLDSAGTPAVFQIVYIFSYTGTYGTAKVKVQAITAPASGYLPAVSDTLHLKGAVTASYAGTYAAATCRGIGGMENFVLSPSHSGSNLDLHGLTVYTHSGTVWNYPELCSLIDTGGSVLRWPTPLVFLNLMDEVYNRGFDPPTRWLMGRGVRTLMFQAEGMYKSYNTGFSAPMASVDGGVQGSISITTEKGPVEFVVSAFVPQNSTTGGTVYGMRPDCFVHYAPKGSDAIQWLGDSELLGNGGSMFFVANATSGGRSKVYEAPFDFWFERGCVKPQSLAKATYLQYASAVS